MRASTRLTILTAPRHGGSLYAIVNNKSRRAMQAAMGAHVSNPVGRRNIVPGGGPLDARRSRRLPASRHGDAPVICHFKPIIARYH